MPKQLPLLSAGPPARRDRSAKPVSANEDKRSRDCVFVSHCLLAQAVRAEGLAKYYAAAVNPVVEFCLHNNINIMQMPCPELECAEGGLGRAPHGKAWYEEHGLRDTAREIAKGQVQYIQRLVARNFRILAIIGMEFSPACAVSLLNRGPVVYRSQGIYVEELQLLLAAAGLSFRFIGVNQRALRKLETELQSLIEDRS